MQQSSKAVKTSILREARSKTLQFTGCGFPLLCAHMIGIDPFHHLFSGYTYVFNHHQHRA